MSRPEPWQIKRTKEVVALLKEGKITNGEAMIVCVLLDVLVALERLREAAAPPVKETSE